MFRNYFRITWRNLKKYKFISFINLFGLTVGLSCCLLITAYILNELSYDRYNTHSDDIYRVERTFLNTETGAVSLQLGALAPAFGPLFQTDFDEIKTVFRILPVGTMAFKYGENSLNEEHIFFTDSNLFDLFDVEVTQGDASTALNDPYSIMLTEEVAKKYFGNEDPMNKVIRLDNKFDVKVTGIYKTFPQNAHWHPNVMLSFATLNDPEVYGAERLATNWDNNAFFTYFLLAKGTDPQNLEAQLPDFLDRHMGVNASDWSILNLRKLTDIHLYSHTDSELEMNADIKRVYIFSAIAFFILLIACINYMNLSSARSVLRAREIGVRKATGAGRGELMIQFLWESVFMSWLATVLAILLTITLLPLINHFSGQQLSLESLGHWKVVVIVVLVPFIVGVLSGIYPALYLSSFQPVKVLKGIIQKGGENISFRKALVVFQFSISIILIIATIIVFQQLNYIQNKALGFDRDHVITLRNSEQLDNSFESFKETLLTNVNIKEVSRSSRVPSSRLLDMAGYQIDRGDDLAPTSADIKYVITDEGFIPTYGITMVAGRNFYDGRLDTSSFLMNEAAVRALGIASNDEAIGKSFRYDDKQGVIAGIFNDFNFESLHERIGPLVLLEDERYKGSISIKISGNIPAALKQIETTWKKKLPGTHYDYRFLESRYANLYQSEQSQSKLFTVFSCLAIFIACLGLFGLSAFTITQRIKEIGIRKVLGASISSIVRLISKDFLILVVIAAVVAFPVAWYVMNGWLEDFAYRIEINWWVFALAGIVAILIALITISSQAIKAAIANPVDSLRDE